METFLIRASFMKEGTFSSLAYSKHELKSSAYSLTPGSPYSNLNRKTAKQNTASAGCL